MEIKQLAREIRAYRKYTKLNKSQFAERIGVNSRTLSRLEDGEHILMETRQPFINALENKTIKPGDMPTTAVGRGAKRVVNSDPRFAVMDLPPPLGAELTQLIDTAKRYRQLIITWGKTHGRPTMAARMIKLVAQLIIELERPKSNVPKQRHCMMLGMMQGFMIKEGVITIDEAFDDQNTLYYVDQSPKKGVSNEQLAASRQTS